MAHRTLTSKKHRRGRLAVLVAAIMLLTACSGGQSTDAGQQNNTTVPAAQGGLPDVTWAVEAEPSTLDPIYDYGWYDNTIVSNMCEPLVKMNADLSTQDWLATANMVDPLTWTYDLKPGLTFWDGSPVTPEDVVYSFERNMNPEVGSYFGSYFGRVQSVSQSGPQQVTVKLAKPDALWNTSTILTAGAYIVSKKYAESKGDKFGNSEGGLMCTGPYEFGNWTPGDSITLKKYDRYWNTEAAAKTDNVKFVFLSDSSAQANALTSGSAQGMYVRDTTLVPLLKSSGGQVYTGPGLTYQMLSPTAKPGPLNDTRVRQALSKSIDRKAIATTIFGGAANPMKTMVGEDAWGPDKAVVDVYRQASDALPDLAQDLDGAKKLVEEVGSPTAPIVMAYPTAGGAYQLKLASVVQDSARKVGLDVELKPLSPTESAKLYEDPDGLVAAGIDILMVTYNVNNADPFGMYQTWDPEAQIVDNYSHWVDPAVTVPLEQAAGTYDGVRRAQLTVEAQDIIMESLPVIPVVAVDTVLFLRDGVTGPPASFSQIWSAWANQIGKS